MSVEIVKNIKEIYNHEYDGFLITTNIRTISILVTNMAYCCEEFGIVSSLDPDEDLELFNNSELKCIEFIHLENEKTYKTKIFEFEGLDDSICFDCSFIKIKTGKGDLDLGVYNSHNGFYGHEIKIETKEIEVER